MGYENKRRAGLTLVELVVVTAIIGTFVSLLLPAIQSSREAARRITCVNNLKQCGHAMHGYQAYRQCFPGVGSSPTTCFSVQAKLLPYAEQMNLQVLIDFSEPLFIGPQGNVKLNPVQAAAAQTQVPIFLCPSDTTDPSYTEYMVNVGYKFAGGNYVICTGSGTGTTYDIRYRTDGLFYYDSDRDFLDIKDGSSNTLLMTESLLGSHRNTTGFPPEDWWRQVGWPGGNYNNFNSGEPGFVGVVNPDLTAVANGCTNWQGSRCSAWIVGRPLFSAMSTYLVPNSPIPDIAGKQHMGFFAARSKHPNGVNALMADGSVRFVGTGVSLTIWRALGTCRGNEITGEF